MQPAAGNCSGVFHSCTTHVLCAVSMQVQVNSVTNSCVPHHASNNCRDTKNHTMLSPDRHQGGLKTTNALAFTPPTQFDKPEFARKPLIR